MTGERAASVLAVALVAGFFASVPTAQSIGVCNGMQGDGLPSADDVVQLYKSNGITGMRIYAPDPDTLQALQGTSIGLVMDVGNDQLAALASDPSAANALVQKYIQPYQGSVSIKYIAVGNEVTGGDTQSILPAMHNINAALSAAGLGRNIKVSTAVRMDVLAVSSPPSAGAFRDTYMAPIVHLLASTGAPLLANVYPYFAFQGDQGIDLNYALFQPSSTTVEDNGLTYTNLFDAMVDAVYSAMEKAGEPGVPIVVSESGWPSASGIEATADNARKYNQGLIDHVGKGTPKRPEALETYIFAMFNENKKPGDETEKHFGLFNGADKSPVYPITF